MAKEQQPQQQPPQQQSPPAMVDEDFDDLSLFVSGSGSSSLRSFNLNTTDSGSILSGLQGEQESPEDLEETQDAEAQQVCLADTFMHFMNVIVPQSVGREGQVQDL